MIYPEDVDAERKELIPAYNRAGTLESVEMDGNNYVNHIAYNAQGKRLLIAYENGIMTRYAYDNRTFRIVRQRSESYTKTDWTYTSGGSVQQDTAHFYDLIGNIIKLNEKTTGCGVGGTDTLLRDFEYDPLYRLINGTGRENSPTITPIWDDRYRSTDNATTTAYTQNYSYDKLGNIQVLQHLGNNNFTRNFNYTAGNNQLQSVDIGMSNFAFTYDACGNQISETTSRHFEWDFGNRLRSFYVQAGISEPTQYAQYLYDAEGVRVKKLVRIQGGDYTSTVYLNDVFEYKTDGTDEQNLLHIMDDQARIAMVRLGATFGDTTPAIKYNLDDYLGNSSLLLETSGALINKEEYYPFGETSFGSYAKKRYKFSGKERDEESGLYYCKFRYHSAWTCRFISVDPLAPKYPHYCSYSFAGNKVISAVELEGLEEKEINMRGASIEIDGEQREFKGSPDQADHIISYAIGTYQRVYWQNYKSNPSLTIPNQFGINAQGQGVALTELAQNEINKLPESVRQNVTNALSNIVRAEQFMITNKIGTGRELHSYLVNWKSSHGKGDAYEKYMQFMSVYQTEAIRINVGMAVTFIPLILGTPSPKLNQIPKFNFAGRGGNISIPANRLNHIFGKSEHALDDLVKQFGSQEKAYNAVQSAANQALKSGKLTPNANGILPSGNAGNIINVGGTDVRLIGGRVANGEVVLSSFSRKGL